MPIPTWSVGQVLAAADVNNWLVPTAVAKVTDQSVTSSTTLVGDAELLLACAANAVYDFRCSLNYEGGTGGSSDIKWQWTVPASATLRYFVAYVAAGSGVNVLEARAGADVITARSAGAGNRQGSFLTGSLVTASTPGNLTLTWAQNTSNATPTIVRAQSCLVLQRIG